MTREEMERRLDQLEKSQTIMAEIVTELTERIGHLLKSKMPLNVETLGEWIKTVEKRLSSIK